MQQGLVPSPKFALATLRPRGFIPAAINVFHKFFVLLLLHSACATRLLHHVHDHTVCKLIVYTKRAFWNCSSILPGSEVIKSNSSINVWCCIIVMAPNSLIKVSTNLVRPVGGKTIILATI